MRLCSSSHPILGQCCLKERFRCRGFVGETCQRWMDVPSIYQIFSPSPINMTISVPAGQTPEAPANFFIYCRYMPTQDFHSKTYDSELALSRFLLGTTCDFPSCYNTFQLPLRLETCRSCTWNLNLSSGTREIHLARNDHPQVLARVPVVVARDCKNYWASLLVHSSVITGIFLQGESSNMTTSSNS